MRTRVDAIDVLGGLAQERGKRSHSGMNGIGEFCKAESDSSDGAVSECKREVGRMVLGLFVASLLTELLFCRQSRRSATGAAVQF